MMRANWRVLAFGALFGVMALPASAQVVIGGSGAPSVEVNWAVLDSLGRQPTLADLLKGELPPENRVALAQPGAGKTKGVQFRPYQPGGKVAAKGKAVAAAKPKKSPVQQASAKAAPMADLVQSSGKPVQEASAEVKPVDVPHGSSQPPVPPKPQVAPVEAPKAATAPVPASTGPQVALPEVPKPAAPAPVQTAKAEPPAAPAPAPVPTPAKAEPAPAPKAELPPPR